MTEIIEKEWSMPWVCRNCGANLVIGKKDLYLKRRMAMLFARTDCPVCYSSIPVRNEKIPSGIFDGLKVRKK